MRPKYYVTTWDHDKEKFTPQKGVRTGPYSMWGLRRAIRALRSMGYTAEYMVNGRMPDGRVDSHWGDPSVRIERSDQATGNVAS